MDTVPQSPEPLPELPPMEAPLDPPYLTEVPMVLPEIRLPRLWTVFVVYAVTLVALLGVSVAVVFVLFIDMMGRNLNPHQMVRELESAIYRPGPLMATLALTQGVMLVVTLSAGWLSPRSFAQRLGLTRSTLPWWAYPCVMIAGPALALPGSLLLEWLGLKGDSTFFKAFEHVSGIQMVSLMLAMSVLPGFIEELLFRGYIQRRLLERWSPGWAILTTTLLFAFIHFHPHTMVALLPIGIWLGVLAWRTGSIWPGVACHFFNNLLAAFMLIGTVQWGWPEDPPLRVTLAFLGVGAVCFALSVWALVRTKPPVPSEQLTLVDKVSLPIALESGPSIPSTAIQNSENT